MARQIPDQDVRDLLRLVGAQWRGASLEELSAALPWPRRTLQRRLALLVERGLLEVRGLGRATRYLSVTHFGPSRGAAERAAGTVAEPREEDAFAPRAAPAESAPAAEAYVPLSPEGAAVRDSVRRPLQLRKPVGYQRWLLDIYQPNRSSYLPPALRVHLRSVGDTAGGQGDLRAEPLPAGTWARQILSRLLIDLSWNSSRLEGNSYSLLETRRLLELGETAEGKAALDAQMILNHKAAIEYLVESAGEIDFRPGDICNLHGILSENLLQDVDACGRLRRIPVGISHSVYHPPAVPQLIEEQFEILLDKAAATRDPFEQAFFVMVHLPYLQPFEDVNKRVSRLAANIPLVRHNLCPLSFVDVPARAYLEGHLGIYEEQRIELLRDVFVWAYERSAGRYSAVAQSLGQPDPFRLRYRTQIKETVAEAVRRRLPPREATLFVQQAAVERVPEGELSRFVDVVETELLSLHAGNFARFRLRPSEFEAWQPVWQAG
jgi:hypothetical protein